MKKRMLWIVVAAVAMLSATALQAQDIAGDWQGTLKGAGPDSRLVLHINKTDKGVLSATLQDIDEEPDSTPVTSITVQESTLKFSINTSVAYEGRLSADRTAIIGSWKQDKDSPKPLEFHKATKETAWPLPDPNWGHTLASVDARTFDGYVGQYQLTAPHILLSISREGNHLYLQLTGQPRFELFPASEKEYFLRVVRAEVSFNTDGQGAATGLVLHQGGRDIPAKRIVATSAADVIARCSAIDSMVAAEFAKHPAGSVTIGVVAGNQLVWNKSYGNADMEKKLPADKDTIYRIGSITKMFTALMLEQLVDAGKVHLSDPVEKYFPEVNKVTGRFANAPPITLVQLAKHTSGLDREPADMDTYVQGPVSEWEKTLIAALPHTSYAIEPGTQFSYSNIGYAILGATLARAAGEPYTDYLPKHIFTPLGMSHTALEFNPEMLPHLSKGYEVGPSGKLSAEDAEREHKTGRGYKVPNGAIYTTVGDLGRFASFLMGEGPDTVLKAAVLEKNLMQSAVQADYALSSGYTLGGQVTRCDNYVAFGHGGGVAGYQAALQMNREAKVAVIVLVNAIGETVASGELALKALDMLSK